MGETGGEPRSSAPGPLGRVASSRGSGRVAMGQKRHRVAGPLRGITIASGLASAAGASLAGYPRAAAGAIVLAALTGLTIIGELWIVKRRDDVFSKIASQPHTDIEVLRQVTIHEAVRAGRLSSEDTVRLLRSMPDQIGDRPSH